MSPHKASVAEFAARWLVPILLVFLIPVFSVVYVWDHNGKVRQYESSVSACERGNLLRTKINDKFDVYDKAFRKAGEALALSTTPAGKELYAVLTAAASTAPDPLPLTDCMAAFDKPTYFWQ